MLSGGRPDESQTERSFKFGIMARTMVFVALCAFTHSVLQEQGMEWRDIFTEVFDFEKHGVLPAIQFYFFLTASLTSAAFFVSGLIRRFQRH